MVNLFDVACGKIEMNEQGRLLRKKKRSRKSRDMIMNPDTIMRILVARENGLDHAIGTEIDPGRDLEIGTGVEVVEGIEDRPLSPPTPL